MFRALPMLIVALAALALPALPGRAAEPSPAPAASLAPAAKAPAANAMVEGTGGLAELAPDDVKALREASALTRGIAADETEDDGSRTQALRALARINEALSAWGTPGLAAWYLDLLATTKSSQVQEHLLIGGQAAARGGTYHLGGVREFWRQVDILAADPAKPIAAQADRYHKEFDRLTSAFDKPPKVAPKLPPLVLQPVKLNLKGVLQPLPEEKKPAK